MNSKRFLLLGKPGSIARYENTINRSAMGGLDCVAVLDVPSLVGVQLDGLSVIKA